MAYKNPERDVFIVYVSSTGLPTNSSLWSKTHKTIINYPNIHFVNIRLEDLTDNLQLKKLLTRKNIFNGKSIDGFNEIYFGLSIWWYVS